jgi:hypothetical protein
MEDQIKKIFNGATVSEVVVDAEFGNVTATVNGKHNVDCGFVEDFGASIEVAPVSAAVIFINVDEMGKASTHATEDAALDEARRVPKSWRFIARPTTDAELVRLSAK